MDRAALFLPALLLSAGIAPAQIDRIGVDPRVELFCTIFRLAGAAEYQQSRVPAYAQAVDAWFGPYRDHNVVLYARQLRQTGGISYDPLGAYARVGLHAHVAPLKLTIQT